MKMLVTGGAGFVGANMFGKDYPRVNLPVQQGEYDRTLADYSLA